MASMIVDGVRMDWVRRCYCGRRPEISTSYEGFDPGFGPFLIKCSHGKSVPEENTWTEYSTVGLMALSRSWSKTRVVENWKELMRRCENE